jgi:hypothetical protein
VPCSNPKKARDVRDSAKKAVRKADHAVADAARHGADVAGGAYRKARDEARHS